MDKKDFSDRTRILIIDDHPLFREGLKSIINKDCRFVVIGEAGNADEGLQMARTMEPDVIMVDISLPDISGIQISREIKDEFPMTKIMIVTMHSEMSSIVQAFKAGVSGYLIKESASIKLIECLEAVLKGRFYFDDSLSDEIASIITESSVDVKNRSDQLYSTLTPREQEIMRLILTGFSYKEVAKKISISPKTVRNHSSNIMSKLGLKNSVELIRYAVKIGLIDKD